jgi:hypothetical protein
MLHDGGGSENRSRAGSGHLTPEAATARRHDLSPMNEVNIPSAQAEFFALRQSIDPPDA